MNFLLDWIDGFEQRWVRALVFLCLLVCALLVCIVVSMIITLIDSPVLLVALAVLALYAVSYLVV